ncbi:MAG: hypothetical protein JWQ28_3173 [Pedobacter sp.]|jgi:hypothetical protein|nr:hypothetical protein [Pedobacter sp.]
MKLNNTIVFSFNKIEILSVKTIIFNIISYLPSKSILCAAFPF